MLCRGRRRMGELLPFKKWFRKRWRSQEPTERTQLDWKRARQTGAPGRSFRVSRLGFFLLSAVIVAGVLALGPWRPTDTLGLRSDFVSSQPQVTLPKVIRHGPSSPPSAVINVIDGDTVRSGGNVYRLVGFDTPESGSNARCAAERSLAARATFRLRQLVAGGGTNLQRVPCACRTGTEGTRACNFGRLCARLTAGGRDVGTILIAEGLARAYHCSGTRCPPRQSWC
jgi:endonuclease YncB( thermonuclease family)